LAVMPMVHSLYSSGGQRQADGFFGRLDVGSIG